MYQIQDLSQICIKHIRDKINKGNVCTLLETAQLLSNFELKKLSLDYVERHTSYITQTDGFLMLSKDTLLEILQNDNLVVTECELFESVLLWAKFQYFCSLSENQKKDIKTLVKDFWKLPRSKEQKQSDEIVQIVKDIVPHIRYPLMSPDALLDFVEPSGVVPEQYLHEAYRFISLQHRPSIFNSVRTKKRRGEVGKEMIKFNPNACHHEVTLSYDLLQARKSSNSRNWATCVCSRGVEKGRHFWEFRIDQCQTGHIMIGVGSENADLNNFHSSTENQNLMYYCWNGRKYHGMNHSPYGSQCKQKDIVGLLIDMDKKLLEFYKNGISQGIAFTKEDFNQSIYFPIISLFDLSDQITIIPTHQPKLVSTEENKK